MTYQRNMGEHIALKPVARTGWPAPAMAQDDDRKLFKWFASRLDARRRVRERVAEIEDEANHPYDLIDDFLAFCQRWLGRIAAFFIAAGCMAWWMSS